MARAAARHVTSEVEALRELAKNDEELSEEPASSYGGSFRYWRKNTDGKAKMILGVNVSGERRDTPQGQLDIWVPANSLAQVLGIPEQQAKDLLRKLPVLDMKTSDCIIRLQNHQAAQLVAKSFREWFAQHPGFYGAAEPAAK